MQWSRRPTCARYDRVLVLARHRPGIGPLACEDALSRAEEAPPAHEMLHVSLLAPTSHFATITHFVFMMRDVRPRGVGAA